MIKKRKPLVLLAGVHAGCYELFANEQVRAIRDLKARPSRSSTSATAIMFWSRACQLTSVSIRGAT
jgi:hypothetical protein